MQLTFRVKCVLFVCSSHMSVISDGEYNEGMAKCF